MHIQRVKSSNENEDEAMLNSPDHKLNGSEPSHDCSPSTSPKSSSLEGQPCTASASQVTFFPSLIM